VIVFIAHIGNVCPNIVYRLTIAWMFLMNTDNITAKPEGQSGLMKPDPEVIILKPVPHNAFVK
ncbi:hypothetical protein, partial [Enterococcus faecalis]|uniref:hypothetical protein n=1 Tax=Enterococcus faecalis TaxID=1351 RepID=UPI003984BB96